MRDENYGSFDYFFDFENSFFDKNFVSNILMNKFLSFDVSGYNGNNHFVGYMRNNNGHLEQPIKKEVKGSSITVATYPEYYIDPKLELIQNDNESTLIISYIKNENLVMEYFCAKKGVSTVSVNGFIYDENTLDFLLDRHKDEMKNATLSFEKMQMYSRFPAKTIQKEIDSGDSKAYLEYTDELNERIEEISKKNKTRR